MNVFRTLWFFSTVYFSFSVSVWLWSYDFYLCHCLNSNHIHIKLANTLTMRENMYLISSLSHGDGIFGGREQEKWNLLFWRQRFFLSQTLILTSDIINFAVVSKDPIFRNNLSYNGTNKDSLPPAVCTVRHTTCILLEYINRFFFNTCF